MSQNPHRFAHVASERTDRLGRETKQWILTVLPCIWFSGFVAAQSKLNDRKHNDCNLGPCALWP